MGHVCWEKRASLLARFIHLIFWALSYLFNVTVLHFILFSFKSSNEKCCMLIKTGWVRQGLREKAGTRTGTLTLPQTWRMQHEITQNNSHFKLTTPPAVENVLRLPYFLLVSQANVLICAGDGRGFLSNVAPIFSFKHSMSLSSDCLKRDIPRLDLRIWLMRNYFVIIRTQRTPKNNRKIGLVGSTLKVPPEYFPL